MAQLREIKSRIVSVRSTQKITSAMMMVSSARLMKAQRLIQGIYPYQQGLYRILRSLAGQEGSIDSPFLRARAVKRVAIVAFSSNTGLAGRFNDNIIERLKKVVAGYMPLGKENILIYPVGGKVARAVRALGFEPRGDYSAISENPSYDNARLLAEELTALYLEGETDHVELVYHHFLTKGSQAVTNEPMLPIKPEMPGDDDPLPNNYIVEPGRDDILARIIPKILNIKLYAAHLDSVTSEHAARTTAMRIATDNADDLGAQLTIEYNKLRQQSITNELLDLAGGMAR